MVPYGHIDDYWRTVGPRVGVGFFRRGGDPVSSSAAQKRHEGHEAGDDQEADKHQSDDEGDCQGNH